MAFYNPNSGPYAGPLTYNAMGRAPATGGFGGMAGSSSVTQSPAAADAARAMQGGGAEAGMQWLQLLKEVGPMLQQMGQRDRGGAAEAGVPSLQAMPAIPQSAGSLAQLLERRPLTDPYGRPLPGLLG